MMQIKLKGLEKTQQFLVQLPKSMNKEIMQVSDTFMRSTQKSAKLRAPRLTGRLADSIEFKKIKNQILLIVNSPYGYFQEYGFTPHFIHSDMSDRMGGTVGGLFGRFNSFFWVAKHKPFIQPALEQNLSNLPNLLSQGTKKAIKQAGG